MHYTKETDELVGSLCAAWANLESETERTIWGILDVNNQVGPIITRRLDIRARWELVLEYASRKHDDGEIATLKEINSDVAVANRDRNIIVHGLVHMKVSSSGPIHDKQISATDVDAGTVKIERPPCWTAFRGRNAGKNFPASTGAVRIVRDNIKKIADRIREFNDRHGYHESTQISDEIETDWPKPI